MLSHIGYGAAEIKKGSFGQMSSVLLLYDGNSYTNIQEKDFLVLKDVLSYQVVIQLVSLLEIHGFTSSILLRHLYWDGSRGKSKVDRS